MQRMAHGWDSYFQDLPPLSSDPRTLTRTTTTESEGSLSQQLENFIGNHDFTDAVDSQDTAATNCYSNASVGNSSSDCVYQKLYRDTLWQGNAEQMEKDYSPTRENSDISDFTTDGLSTLGSIPSSFATNLQGFKQDCGMLAASFLEDFSDNYSQSHDNMTIDGGEEYPGDNKEKQVTAAAPNSITTFSNQKENLKDEKVLKEKTETLQQENVGTDHLDSTDTDDQDKTLRQDKDEKSLKRKRKASGSSDAETFDEKNAPNSNCTNVQVENEKKEMHLNTQTSDPAGIKLSDLKNITNDLIESTSSNNSHDAERCLQSSEHQPHENVAQGDICRNLAAMSNIVSHIGNPSDKEEHNIEKNQTGTTEEMNNTSADPNCSGSGVSGDSHSIEISDQSKHSGDPSTRMKPGLKKKLTDPERSSAAATSDRNKQNVSSPKETSLQPNTSSTDTNLCLQKDVTSPSEMKSTTSATDPECSGLEDTSDKNEKSVGGCPDSCSQPESTSKIKLSCVEKEQINPAEQTNTSSPECSGPAVTSDNKELCVISSTEVNSSKKGQSISRPEKTMASSSQDQSLKTLDPQSPTEDVDERARESSEQSDKCAEEQLVPDALYGEPLSGEDSSFEMDETKIEGSACKETSEGNSIDLSDGQTPQLKSSGQMRKHLQPVVLLKTSESMSELSNSYHCGVCQHMTNNVDDLIEHHHHCHSVHNFQICKTCNLYLVGNDGAKKHLCNVKKQNLVPSNSTKLKRKKRHGPYRCGKCKITFSKVIHHIRHMRTHTGKTPFLCKECGIYFAQGGTLKRHKRIPGRCKAGKSQDPSTDTGPCEPQTQPQKEPEPKKPVKNLPKCYVQLVDISKTHLCSLCDTGFLTAKKAKKHFYNLHKNKLLAVSLTKCTTKVSVENTPSVDNDLGEKYKCPLCPRLFKYSYNRARHLRDCVRHAVSSSQDKAGKYRCPLCKGYFTLASNRYRHIKTFCLKECLNRLAKERAGVKQQDVTKVKTKVTDAKKQTKATEEKMPSKEIVVKKQQPPPPQTPPPPPPPPNVSLKGSPRYRCALCPAVFYHASGKYRHMKKHELFKLTGKMFKYRNSLLSTVSKPATLSSKKTEDSKDDLKPTEDKHSNSLKCRFCEKCFSSLEILNKHARNHRGERPYRCVECGKGFKKQCHLVTHKNVHQRRIQCTVCRKILPTIGELIQHRNSHLKRGDLKCPDCPQQFKFPAHLLRHLDSHRNKQKKATELEETQPSKPQQPLESVKEESGPKQIQCSLCKEAFDDLQVLRKHCLTHISGSNQCPFCKRSFTNRRYLVRHMIRHTGDKPFSCTNCGKQFYRDLYLKLHRERCLHGQTTPVDPGETKPKNKRPYWCLFCPRTFSKKIRLKNHHRGHKTNSLIQCVKCGQYYGSKVNHHEKNCDGSTGLNTTSLEADVSKNASQTTKCVQTLPSLPSATKILQFKCPHCPQKFRYRSLLFRHLVSHTGVQPYACMHCGYRFRTRSMCLQHEAFCNGVFKDKASDVNSDVATDLSDMPTLREAGQKQTSDSKSEYKCTFCTKTFMKARNLRRHILTHNEVKPYRCKACDSCFSRYDHLKVHQGRCKGKRTRLEVCIPKISLDDVGKGWQNKYNITTTEKQEIFTCDVCSRNFPTASKLSRHNTMYHTVKLFKCTRCSSSFSHEKTLKQHKKSNRCRRVSNETHAPVPLETNPPAKTVPEPHIPAKQEILQRIRPCFNKKYKFVCSYCPRIFGNSWQLGVHTRLHTGERPYSCEYCGESFIRKDYVQRHHAKCTEKEQQLKVLCERCGGFFSKDKIEYHKRNCPAAMANVSKAPTCQTKQPTSQSPPKGFSCAYCSSRFLLFSQLQEHFLNAHKLETMVPPASTVPLQHHLSNIPRIKEEPVDEVCDKQPSEGANLTCKLDTALNREIICPECNMTFANRAGLSGHLRTHATERPYNCKICKKGFWNRNIFHNHEKKCKSPIDSEKKTQEGPLKAELNFALTDSVLLFKDSSTESGTGVLQTNFSCKDELTEVSVQNPSENPVQSNSIKEKKTVQYQCSECEESFTDGLLLISHLEDHGRQEQEKKRNTCFKCGQVCSSQAKLEKHMRIHGPAQKYPCPDCSKTVDSLAELEVHRTFHDPNRRFVCKLCNQRFWTRPSLYNHYEVDHPTEAYFCRFCNKSYSVKKSLSRHNRKCHQKEMQEFASTLPQSSTEQHQPSSHVSTGESDDNENNGTGDSDSDSAPYFPCHVCTKTFPTSESLEDHQRCHLGEKPHECGECGRCFYQASQLQQHQRMHKSEFQCQVCGRGFVSLFALRKHKHSHGKNRPYRCPKCHISFKGHSQLAEHMMSHREENFPCDICNRVFLSKSSRAEHRKCHSKSDDRPTISLLKPEPEKSPSLSDNTLMLHKELKYRCGVCNERFRDPEELSEHGCMAVKERPYSCLDCDKHFLHASHLKKHRNTHQPSRSSGEYPCGQCSHSFFSAQHFLSHLKTHVGTTAEVVLNSDNNDGGPSRSFICPICHRCLPSATELIGHFPTHLDGTFECKICKGTFPSRSKLEEHENCHLTSTTEFECTRCGQTFLGNDAFSHHSCSPQQQIRPESKYSKPSVEISSPGYYPAAGHEEEIDVTGEEVYSCSHCTLQFSSKISFLEHQNREHVKAKPFKCDLCGKEFALRRYLREHERRHRLKLATPNTAETKLTCSQCAAEFETSQDLSLHKRLHAEKEGGTYRCDMCYKSFSHWALLKKHQESHVGEVVYECTECDKAFAFPHLLEEHQQTHAGSSRS